MSTEFANGASNGARPFKLAAAQVDGEPAVVLLLDSRVYCLRDLLPAGASVPDHLDALFGDWLRWHPILVRSVAQVPQGATAVEPERWLVPVRPSKLICVGVNYHDHLREMGTARAPEFPYSFLKPVSTGLVAVRRRGEPAGRAEDGRLGSRAGGGDRSRRCIMVVAQPCSTPWPATPSTTTCLRVTGSPRHESLGSIG